MSWIHRRKGGRRILRYPSSNLFWGFVLRRDQVELEREVDVVTEYLDKTTLEDQQVEIPIEAVPPDDASMKEVHPVSDPLNGAVLTKAKHPESENPLPTPPK